MSDEQPSNESEIDRLSLPENLLETVLKKCETKNMEKMGYCAPNLSDWLPAKFIKGISMCNLVTDSKVLLDVVFVKTPDSLNDVMIEGSFENLENGTKTRIGWIIKHANTTSQQNYLIDKNYIELALVEFQKYLNLSRDNIQELEVMWDDFDFRIIHPKMFKSLRRFLLMSDELLEQQKIGYDSEDVLNWKMDYIRIEINHWTIEDFQKIIINWVERTDEKELDIGIRKCMISETCFKRLDRSKILNGPVQPNGHQNNACLHPIFPDYGLWIRIIPFPLENFRVVMFDTAKISGGDIFPRKN